MAQHQHLELFQVPRDFIGFLKIICIHLDKSLDWFKAA